MTSAVTTGLVAIVVLGLGVALWAGPNVEVGAPAAAVAVLAAAGLAVEAIRQRLVPIRLPTPRVESDTLVVLGEAFSSGQLGRRSILASLAALEHAALGDRRRPPALEEEERLLSSSAEEFRRWVDGRLSELERIS